MTQLTVGLPVYNGMPFLPESLSSLLLQDDGDFHILIIDDGSTDESAEYLKTVKDRRVRILHQKNSGLTSTLNRMLAEVKTPWLVRHDADDIAYPNRLRLIRQYIRKYPAAGMFYSLASYYPENRGFGTFRTTVASPADLRSLTRTGYLLAMAHPTVTLNVQQALAVGGYRFNLHVEDVDLWWRMALHSDIVLIPEYTLSVRHNFFSASNENLRDQSLNTLYIQYLLLSHLWERCPLPHETIKKKLSAMVNEKELRFRRHIRTANINIGAKAYGKACIHTVKAFTSSPEHFLKRIFYELRSRSPVVNGASPAVFAAASRLLWEERA